MEIEILPDQDRRGRLVLIKGGCWRFAATFSNHNGDDNWAVTIPGFRVTRDFRHLLIPHSQFNGKAFPAVRLTPVTSEWFLKEFKERFYDAIPEALKPQG